MRPALIACLLLSAPAFAETPEVPPEVQALAEATCKADEFCETTEMQMFPSRDLAFLWLEGSMDCGSLGCRTFVLHKLDGVWQVMDVLLVTQPMSVTWAEGSDLVFDGPTGFAKSGEPLCHLIWNWTGTELQATDGYLTSGDCAVE